MTSSIKKNETFKPLPFYIYFYTVFVVALAGLIDSIYLAISHHRVYTDIGYRSFCSISKSVNCDTVSQSAYSIFLNLPVPVWGVIGYLFFIILLCFTFQKDAQKKRIWSVLFILSFAYSLYSLFLAYISLFNIQAYCFMCIVSYGVNFVLMYFTWMVRKRFDNTGILRGLKDDIKYIWERKLFFMPIVIGFVLGSFLMTTLMPNYWDMKPPEISRSISKGITEDGHPWIGAKKPEIEIIELTDYMCFQCKKMHFYLRQIVEKNPDKIRLIHRHFPMDHRVNPIVKNPIHVGTGGLSIFAIYAASKGKFWIMNDILFSIDRESRKIDINKLARLSGLNVKELKSSIYDPKNKYYLDKDILFGIKNGVVGTPSYIINGKVYKGQIPPDILSRLLNN